MCAPVVVRQIPGQGRGLVASKNIQMGDLIIKETGVIALPADIGMWEAGEEVAKQVWKMNNEKKEEFFQLTCKQGLLDISSSFLEAAGNSKDNLERAKLVAKNIKETAIFFNNDIATEDGYKCLFPTLALTNHSCAPNSSWAGKTETPRHLELRAVKDINEGEEITVNYIIVEGRFSDKDSRQARLNEGWEFGCRCPLCLTEAEEEFKQQIRDLQSEMTSECDQSVDHIDWDRLSQLQIQLVLLVKQLSCAPTLLPREFQSLVHLAQLGRDKKVVLWAMEEWKQLVERLNSKRALCEYNLVLKKLEEWRNNLKKKLPPHEQEVKEFLWLM